MRKTERERETEKEKETMGELTQGGNIFIQSNRSDKGR